MSCFEALEEYLSLKYSSWEGVAQFGGTGKRLERMFEEMCWTPERIQEEVENHFKAVFSESYSEMLVLGPTSVWTLCPHHLVPCNFEVLIGYIPKDGGVLGLSKFSRVALALGKKPVMQEQYSREVAESFMEHLQPKGCGVYVVGIHGCIVCRGVSQPNVRVTTSVLKGIFLKDPSVKREFFDIVGIEERVR